MTRARGVAGDEGLQSEIETFRQSLLKAKGKSDGVLSDVTDMRRRIAAAKAPADVWDPKIGPGRLQDIELFAQTAALVSGAPNGDLSGQFASGVADGWIDAADAQALLGAAALFWKLQTASRLLTGGVFDLGKLGEGAKRLILRETQCVDVAALTTQLTKAQSKSDAIIRQYLEQS